MSQHVTTSIHLQVCAMEKHSMYKLELIAKEVTDAERKDRRMEFISHIYF